MPESTTVYSSNSGFCPGSRHPSGLCMCATLTRSVAELTRPKYSSMRFGLLPAARIRVGAGMWIGIRVAREGLLALRGKGPRSEVPQARGPLDRVLLDRARVGDGPFEALGVDLERKRDRI